MYSYIVILGNADGHREIPTQTREAILKTLPYLCSILLLQLSTGLVAAPSVGNILPAEDWAEEGLQAQSAGLPIMLVFTSGDCSYCERLKNELLEPLLQKGELDKSVRVREFSIDRGGKVIDFDGERIRSRVFVDRYKIFATPTVVLLDHNGNTLSSPIVGFNSADSYIKLLGQVIDSAQPVPAALKLTHAAGSD